MYSQVIQKKFFLTKTRQLFCIDEKECFQIDLNSLRRISKINFQNILAIVKKHLYRQLFLAFYRYTFKFI